MLPVKLRMQAFASYAEPAEIDFSTLDSLFLIHGETGAGKTAILDAMMYALYGESSGGARSEMRCALPKAQKLSTEVEFTFRKGKELYKFTRSITKSGLTKKSNCFIWNETEKTFRALLDNPTQTSVNAEAIRITGLSKEQFRQVVILPQGQFEKLLTSDSKDKEETLSTLFAGDKYTAISQKLHDKALEEKRLLEAEENERRAMLSAEGVESIDELHAEIDRLKEEKSAAAPKLAKALKARDESTVRLTEAELSARAFAEQDSAKKRLTELESMSDKISGIKLILEKNDKAEKLGAYFLTAENCSVSVRQWKNTLENAKVSAEIAAKNAEKAALAKSVLAQKEEIFLGKRNELAVLEKLTQVYTDISLEKQKKARLDAEIADADRTIRGMNDSLKKLDTDIIRIEGERNEINSRYYAALPALTERKAALERGKQAELNLQQCLSLFKAVQLNISKLNAEAASLAERKSASEKNYLGLYDRYISRTISALSSKLTEGAPCPVCGSVHHPSPAAESDDSVTENEVKSARSEFEKLDEALRDLLAKIAGEEARLPVGEERINENKKIIAECGYTAAELAKISGDTELAQRQCARLPELEKQLAALSTQKTGIEKKLAEHNERLSALRNNLAAVSAKLDTLCGQLDRRYPDENSYRTGMNALKSEIAIYENEKQRTEENIRVSEQRKTETETSVKIAIEHLTDAEKAEVSAKNAFAEKLSEVGFSSEEEFHKARLPEDISSGYRSDMENYFRECSAVTSRLAQLSTELEGKSLPDIESLRQENKSLSDAYTELSVNAGITEEKLSRLSAATKSYDRKFGRIEARREKCDKLCEFASFMCGNRGKCSFTRYMLEIMLGLVTAEANRLLEDVRGGQFHLYVTKSETQDSKGGLDLCIENITQDSSVRYGVKNLSGGEKFLISLALSLGLSSVARSRNGGIEIEAMFIDEGFGSLDPEARRDAMSMLCGAASGRSTVGIISHVEELKNVIPCGINVVKDKDGCSGIK